MGGTEDGLKVGELARAAGLSIRTVRYYDQIGLLTPSRRSSAGHRVYDDVDVRRLYRICLLRRTGLPLAEIGGTGKSHLLIALVPKPRCRATA